VRLPPFIDATDVSTCRKEARRALVREFCLDCDRAVAITVAMMRPGDKLESYRVLARTLATLDRDDLQLLVIGDGPSRGEVEHLLADRAVFAGIRDEESIRRIMAGCDLFIWPAINEAYGMAILLAQACGCPVAAGDAPGVGEIVNHGDTGLLAPTGDAAALAHAVSRLLDDPVLRRSMGDAGRRHVLRHRSYESARRILARVLEMQP